MTLLTHLYCQKCGSTYDHRKIQTFCTKDNQPLLASYNLSKAKDKSKLSSSESSMWRYKDFLPLVDWKNRISLGEGMTPIINMKKIAHNLHLKNLQIKNESFNPTGSFKARGLSMAVSKAKELGITELCIPSAGNAGSALSAYAAKADIKSYIYLPEQTPEVFRNDAQIMGARVTHCQGSIADAATQMKAHAKSNWFDVSTLKEPYRLEGKKTMGYEIAEQYEWKLPEVIIYPTGGGTGLIGIYKAFTEMLEMGWVDSIPSRMIAVQVDVCAPIVHAVQTASNQANKIVNPGTTIANGLRVPSAFGHELILDIINKSKGYAIAVSDLEIMASINMLSSTEGLFVSPEGAATFAALKKLLLEQVIHPDESILLINTGSPYKYLDNIFDMKLIYN